MEARILDELRKRKRDQTLRLVEVADLTNQLAGALDRKDQVSVQMLLSMREAPIRQMQELEEGIQNYLLGLSEEEAIRCNELLRGAGAEAAEEEPLGEQVAKYRRMLESVLETDRKMSLLLGGNKSFYKTFRD